MKCLHICNDFSLTKVHSNLYRALDKKQVEQIVFNPVRKETPVGNNSIDFKIKNSRIIYSKEMVKMHSYLFRKKVKFLFTDLKSKINFEGIDIVHATTLFSDGALALKIKKKYNIPFIVAVRSTDMDAFLRYRPDLVLLARNILKEAQKIIFISDCLKERFFNHYLIKGYRHKFEHKCTIVYNGIDDYWLNNRMPKKNLSATNILFIGRLIARKNAINLANAVISLNNKGVSCNLNFVGAGGSDEEIVKELSEKHSKIIKYLGVIKEKSELKKVFENNHIFAMPSYKETFGLVYIEALSQGLPLLFCKNEAIDGVFDTHIGETCKDAEVSEISKALEKIMGNYDCFELDKVDFSIFRWDNISQIYLNMYSKLISP